MVGRRGKADERMECGMTKGHRRIGHLHAYMMLHAYTPSCTQTQTETQTQTTGAGMIGEARENSCMYGVLVAQTSSKAGVRYGQRRMMVWSALLGQR